VNDAPPLWAFAVVVLGAAGAVLAFIYTLTFLLLLVAA